MPSRNGGGETSLTVSQHRTTSSGASSYSNYQDVVISSNIWWYNGGETANYKSRKARGELLPLNHYTNYAEAYKCNAQWGFRTTNPSTNSWSQWVWTSQCVAPYNFRLDADSILPRVSQEIDPYEYVQAAAAKLYSKGWDVLTFLAELKQVHQMFLRSGQSLIKLIKGQDLHQSWLQYRYGWRVLYYDIQDMIAAINRLDDERKRFRESAGGNLEFSDTNFITLNWPEGLVMFNEQTDFKVGARGVVVADVEPPNVSFNPFITAWELVRFSFIIDWFVNIGQWLAAMSFLAISRKHFCSAGLYVDVVRRPVFSGINLAQNCTIVQSSWDLESKWTIKYRTPASVPLGPTTITRVDVQKIIDLLALIRGSRGR